MYDKNTISGIAMVITFIMMVITIFIALYARSQAKIARKSLLAPVFSELSDVYHTDKMTDEIGILQKWWKAQGVDFDKAFAEKKKKHRAEGKKLTTLRLYLAWRHPKDYFVKCWRYREANIITDKDIKIFITISGAAIYVQIIEPMGIAADRDFEKRPGKMFLDLFPDADNPEHLTHMDQPM